MKELMEMGALLLPKGWGPAAGDTVADRSRGIVLAFEQEVGVFTVSLADKSEPTRELLKQITVEWFGDLMTISEIVMEHSGFRPIARVTVVPTQTAPRARPKLRLV